MTDCWRTDLDFCERFVCPKRAPKYSTISQICRVVKRFEESIAIRERERKNTEKVQGGRSYLALDFNRHSGFD